MNLLQQLSNILKIHPVEAELFRATDGQTDMTKLIGAFRKFTIAPKKQRKLSLAQNGSCHMKHILVQFETFFSVQHTRTFSLAAGATLLVFC